MTTETSGIARDAGTAFSLGEGDLWFASPDWQWHVSQADLGLAAHVPASGEALAALFAQARAQGRTHAGTVFGLVPFDARRPASLSLPERLTRRPVSAAETAAAGAALHAASHTRRARVQSREPLPAPEVYGDAVRAALRRYAAGTAEKIVLARAMDVQLDTPLALTTVMADLQARNRHGYTFALPAWQADASGRLQRAGTMLAASPELLVRREGARIHVNPLAGSIGRHADPAIDAARREGLAVSPKDLHEHAFVVRDIVRILTPLCASLEVPDGPSVIGTDALWHLSTDIHATLAEPRPTALDVALALHPTPAVCGQPTAVAFDAIAELEPFDREYYAGLAGWQHENGDGEWVLTLRCAFQSAPDRLRLYAGAGTVAGSDPEAEILETATKMETFMRAIT
ncbi:MAG: isochorismate synthase [Castellaniella sp.]